MHLARQLALEAVVLAGIGSVLGWMVATQAINIAMGVRQFATRLAQDVSLSPLPIAQPRRSSTEIVLVAAWVPARRAARIDRTTALRVA